MLDRPVEVGSVWHPFDEGRTIGRPESEGGVVLHDQEHPDGARITLERDCRSSPFAITCGIYGWMIHTRYFMNGADAQVAFNQMQEALERLMDMIPMADDPNIAQKSEMVSSALDAFVDRYPT